MVAKQKIVLSDLHLGAGFGGEGNPLEDFHSDIPFSDLLLELANASETERKEVELVLAGDTFEFLQVPGATLAEPFDPRAEYPSDCYASASSEASRTKIERIIAGHPFFFAALEVFIQATAPRRTVTIIKGNHDVNLHWEAVQDAIRAAVVATGENADCLVFEERRIIREGVYIEHGNQYAERISRFPDFEEPHDLDVPGELYQPPGSRLVFRFFNEVEQARYWVDGVKPATALIWYALVLDFSLAIRALLVLLREAPSLIWGSVPVPTAVTEPLNGREQLMSKIAEIDVSAGIGGDPLMRSLVVKELERVMPLYGAPQDEKKVRTRSTRKAILARGWEEERAQRSALAEVAEQKRAQEGAAVIVFGHTHWASTERLENDGVYINSGTWTWIRDFTGSDHAAWKRFMRNPASYTSQRRLSYVRIDYDAYGEPSARLEEFGQPQRSRSLLSRFARWLFGGVGR